VPVPVPVPVPPPPAPSPPPPPPVPAPGTYIEGDVLAKAIVYTSQRNVFLVPNGDTSKPGVTIGNSSYDFRFAAHSSLYGYSPNPINFPPFALYGTFTYASGAMQLQPDLTVYSFYEQMLFSADSRFTIGVREKFVLDKTYQQWTSIDDDKWFVQLQLGTYPASNTAFQLCYHIRTPHVIRRQCGVFDKLTADFRTAIIIDDSRGTGAVTYYEK